MSTDIVWIDMDKSGSDPETDLILNFACFITDKDGNIKSVGPYFAINHPEEEFYKTGGSFQMAVAREFGVLDRCRNSSVKPEQAEDLMLKYLKNNVPRMACPIAGPFIHIDRVFIKKHMPSVDDYLNHDFVHLIQRYYPTPLPRTLTVHRCRDSLLYHINEYNFCTLALKKELSQRFTCHDSVLQ